MSDDLTKEIAKAALRIEWKDTESAARRVAEYAAERIEELEDKLAKAVGLLEAWINVASHCRIEEGVCCCGDNMDTHAEPINCGHLPVDHGAYIAKSLAEETNTTLAKLKGQDDDYAEKWED